jgi:SSS family solute:Na+ symporter
VLLARYLTGRLSVNTDFGIMQCTPLLLAGWAVGTVAGTAMAISTKLTPTFPLVLDGYTFPGYTAVYTVILNLAVAAVLTPVFNAMGAKSAAADQTATSDYFA